MTMESNTAETIAEELGEQNFDARRQLSLIVEALGDEASIALVERAMEIDEEGGERVLDGTRRRTPSGIFFRLARERLPDEAVEYIFHGRSSRLPPFPELEAPTAPRTSAKPPIRRRVIDVRAEMRETVRPPVATPTALEVARNRVASALAPLDPVARRSLLEALLCKVAPRESTRSRAAGKRSKRAPAARAVKSSFVISMPLDTPTKVVLERAKEAGLTLSARDVSEIREALRRRNPVD